MNKIITITTDFGLKDPYQGAMKGAVLSINPKANLVDITHLISSGNILEGALILQDSCGFFPEGTIHVGVVDPGVGSERRPVLIETERYFYIGPDNGLFSLAIRNENIKRAIHLTEKKYFLGEVSNTFHGRDIFGPVAAHLSLGLNPEQFGVEINGLKGLDLPKPVKKDNEITGEIIYIDSFGNLITNIMAEELPENRMVDISLNGFSLKGVSKTYSSAVKGAPLAVISSSGHLEIAVNGGAAKEVLKAKIGEKVRVKAQR